MNSFISYNQYKKNNVLNETYESFVELKILAQDIIDWYSDKIEKDAAYSYIPIEEIYDLQKFIKRDYKVLKEFVNSSIGFICHYLHDSQLDTGSYIQSTEYNLLKELLPADNVKEISKKIEEYKIGLILIDSISMKVGTVIHELQHAYDDFRAKGKLVSTKMGSRFLKKEKLIKNKVRKPDISKAYYRTPHELSAFFVKTLNYINFFYDETEMNLKDFHTLYDEFKENFQGYDYLTSKDKKILARKFSQYYYKLKERNITDE